MTAVKERATDAGTAEEPPLLKFLREAGFPRRLQRMVDLATTWRPAVRELTDLNSLLGALRATKRTGLGQLADELIKVVTDAISLYPEKVQGTIRVILLREIEEEVACSAPVFAEVFSRSADVMGLIRVLGDSPDHVFSATRLRDDWLYTR